VIEWDDDETNISELVSNFEECLAFITWCRDKCYFTKRMTYELVEKFRAEKEREAFYVDPVSVIDGELD
jgi:hypothetical protein